MAFGRPKRHGGATVTTTTTTVEHPPGYKKPGLMSRLTGRSNRTHHAGTHSGAHVGTHAGTAHPVRRSRRAHGTTVTGAPRRKTSVGDKVSGAMMKVKGSLTRRPGVKAAGTRRMHGTDGRGARRVY